jgi:hypothetical protein
LAEVSPSGVITSGTKITSMGGGDEPQCITHDSSGNVYVGGSNRSSLTLNGVSYPFQGGESDGFIAKWGTNCTVGIAEQESMPAEDLFLYPNPAKNSVTLRYSARTGGIITITSAVGQKMYNEKVTTEGLVRTFYTAMAAGYLFCYPAKQCRRLFGSKINHHQITHTMKTSVKLFLLFMMLFANATAQTPGWQWLSRVGGYSGNGNGGSGPDEWVKDVKTDAQGNVYVCGRVCYGANFNGDTMTTYQGYFTLFMAKLNCEGNLVWVRTAGTVGIQLMQRLMVLHWMIMAISILLDILVPTNSVHPVF